MTKLLLYTLLTQVVVTFDAARDFYIDRTRLKWFNWHLIKWVAYYIPFIMFYLELKPCLDFILINALLGVYNFRLTTEYLKRRDQNNVTNET